MVCRTQLLSSIMCLRDFKISIIGSLAGTSYFGPVAGHGIMTHDLDIIRMERKKHQTDRSGTVGGDIQALPAGEAADGYVRIEKKKPKKEEGGN